MGVLGDGLYHGKHCEDASSVYEARLSLMRRLGESEDNILTAQGNIACIFFEVGRLEEALRMRQDVYSGLLRLDGEEHRSTLLAAHNLAASFISLERFAEAKSLLRDTMPVAQRVLRENDDIPSRLKWLYAKALYKDDGATADDLREAIQTLEDAEPIARRVLGGLHPLVALFEQSLLDSRAALGAREQPSDDEDA